MDRAGIAATIESSGYEIAREASSNLDVREAELAEAIQRDNGRPELLTGAIASLGSGW